MNFWKTSFWSLLSTGIKMIAQFFVAKVIAVVSGPAAFGVFGQFQSFISLVKLGSGGVFNSGAVKYTSEYYNQPIKLKRFIDTCLKFATYSSIIIGFFISIFSKTLSFYIFQSYEYRWVIATFGLTLFGHTLNQLFLSIFKGLNYIKTYSIVTIIGAFFSVTLIGVLTFFYSTKGALLGFVLSQLCVFLVSIRYLKKMPFQFSYFSSKMDYSELKKLMLFALMAIITAVISPLVEMFLRSYVAANSSWGDVGYWQAVLRVSDAYLIVVSTIIATYAFPKYSRITNNKELKKEVFSLLAKLVPLAATLAFFIFFLKHYIILVLFSENFLVTKPLFLFQLIGDVFKIASLTIANVYVAKALFRVYITFEIVFTLSYVVLSILCFNFYGLIGLTMAFLINYTAYFSAVLSWFMFFTKSDNKI
jgi:polysaccharide transporter, PST family